ncbi:General stress protein 39 [Polystyrenella longa]|uniref:General stress protein 39 n=1 Tax=Polystyrenella longa TaxID=2528007 RepID=A0A518CSV8_9PLAN|nr:SDR family oxidoreductase [Polystyrenella longa]QDU82313.1 General stress protein 39 [Polystyrenella longa]
MANTDIQTDKKPLMQSEPKPPFPEQHQESPGLESKLDPLPRWRAERYQAACKLTGKRALVTGGDSGIGRAVAYLYAREGADVAITYLPSERTDAEETQKAVEEVGCKCILIEGDLTSAEFCKEVINTTVSELGGIDILVSNAAWQNRKSSVTEVSEEELDRTLKTNVYAYLRLVREAVPHMEPGSAIIATGSEVGLQGSPQLPDYGATKGAIHSLTKCLSRELLDKGIRVNCVAPGPVWTPLNPADAGMTAEDVSMFGKEKGSTPMERPAQPEEVSPSYVFLASDADSSYITGVILPVMGQPA